MFCDHEWKTCFVVLYFSKEHVELQLQAIPSLPVVEEQQMESSSLSLPDRVGPVPVEASVIMEPRREGAEEGRDEQGIPAAAAAAAAVDGQSEDWGKSGPQAANKVLCASLVCFVHY